MIERYARPEMASLWSDASKFDIWLQVELAVCAAWAKRGAIPQESLKRIQERGAYHLERIAALEAEIHHDVIAFLTSVSEEVGPDSRFIHMGMTSSDLLDTTFAIQLCRASDLLLQDLRELGQALATLATAQKQTVMMGRSHGMHAEPITFGLKVLVWYAEFGRHLQRLTEARNDIATGKLSGAVGTFAHIEPEMEAEVCAAFGLSPDPISTQVVQRDRHAHFFSALAGIAASIEKVAVEIRHLQRTEVGEAQEPFGKGQKGSSAMPHKRNPILCENISGLARIVRANALAAFENVALWHERDISHSSVERIIAPDSTVLLDFMLARLTKVIAGLDVDADRMRSNMELSHGLYHSQQVLLALVRAGVPREEAYRKVQQVAMRASQDATSFERLIGEDAFVQQWLSPEALQEVFDRNGHLRHVDTLFERVLKQGAWC